jgi:hypothetical protein
MTPLHTNLSTTSLPQSPVTGISPTTAANQQAWELRKQIIYHFYAYHHFEKKSLISTNSTTTLDILNMNDADLQFLWRTADMIKGLSTQYKLAEYLIAIQAEISTCVKLPGGAHISTHRECLLYKVREYNRGQPARIRFYLRGLGDADWEFMEKLNAADAGRGNLERITSGCEAGMEAEEGGQREREEEIKRETERCLAERWKTMEGLRTAGNGV